MQKLAQNHSVGAVKFSNLTTEYLGGRVAGWVQVYQQWVQVQFTEYNYIEVLKFKSKPEYNAKNVPKINDQNIEQVNKEVTKTN
jgi:hypothetical protein